MPRHGFTLRRCGKMRVHSREIRLRQRLRKFGDQALLRLPSIPADDRRSRGQWVQVRIDFGRKLARTRWLGVLAKDSGFGPCGCPFALSRGVTFPKCTVDRSTFTHRARQRQRPNRHTQRAR
jgi:hypothetical protein